MAAIIYLDIVKTPELNGEVCVHSFVVNPSAKSDRQKDTYFMAAPIGYTRLKLAELCRIIENIGLPTGSQIAVFSSDSVIARTGASFGVEDGDIEPSHNKDLWARLKYACTAKKYKVMFYYSGLLSETVHDVIGQVRAMYEGKERVFDVYDDGTVILPNGEQMTLDDSVVETLRAEYNNAKSANNNGAKGLNVNVGHRETKAYEVLTKTSDTLDEANQTLKDTKHASKEILEQAQIIKNNNKRNIGIAMFIVAVVAIAIGFFVYTNWVQISGQLTGEYKVAVVNVDIPSGDTIEDSELSYKTLSVNEYESLCGSHFVDGDGKMQQDTPVFFVDRTGSIVNKFATSDMKAGDIVMTSSVSAQKASQDMYVVETEDKDGNRQKQTIDGALLAGDTTIQYIARVTTSSGESYDVVLSSIKLRDKTIEDVLNERGASILQSASTTNSADKDSNVEGGE